MRQCLVIWHRSRQRVTRTYRVTKTAITHQKEKVGERMEIREWGAIWPQFYSRV